MTDRFPRLAVLLVSLWVIAQPAFPHPHPDGDSYSNRTAACWAPYGDPSFDFRVVDRPYPRRDVPERAFDGYRRDPWPSSGPGPYRESSPGGDFWSNLPPAGGEIGQVWHGGRQWDGAGARTPGYSGRAPVAGEWRPLAPTQGYRFRGGAPAEFADRGVTPWRSPYRFRPLTEQERRRMNAETGWRPRVAVPVGEGSRGADSLPVEEAYGYRPESWFRRYFGERH